MGNMSYCRFQNTLRDFRECVQALQDGEPLSEDEYNAALKMIAEAAEIADMTKEDLVKRRFDD